MKREVSVIIVVMNVVWKTVPGSSSSKAETMLSEPLVLLLGVGIGIGSCVGRPESTPGQLLDCAVEHSLNAVCQILRRPVGLHDTHYVFTRYGFETVLNSMI